VRGREAVHLPLLLPRPRARAFPALHSDSVLRSAAPTTHSTPSNKRRFEHKHTCSNAHLAPTLRPRSNTTETQTPQPWLAPGDTHAAVTFALTHSWCAGASCAKSPAISLAYSRERCARKATIPARVVSLRYLFSLPPSSTSTSTIPLVTLPRCGFTSAGCDWYVARMHALTASFSASSPYSESVRLRTTVTANGKVLRTKAGAGKQQYTAYQLITRTCSGKWSTTSARMSPTGIAPGTPCNMRASAPIALSRTCVDSESRPRGQRVTST